MKKTYWKDVYGATASLTESKDGTVKLRVFAGMTTTKKTYKNLKSAKSAMNRIGDCWEEVK